VLSLSFTLQFFVSEVLAHETPEMTRKEEVTGLIYKAESYAIIGACFAVYKDKGAVFSNPFTTSAWRSSSNFGEFPSFQKHCKLCSIAGVRFSKHCA